MINALDTTVRAIRTASLIYMHAATDKLLF